MRCARAVCKAEGEYRAAVRELTGRDILAIEFASLHALSDVHERAVARALRAAGPFTLEPAGDLRITTKNFDENLDILRDLHAFEGTTAEFWLLRHGRGPTR